MMYKLLAIGTCLLALFSASEAFHASVKGDGHYCIMFEGNVSGTINYEKKDKTTASYGFSVDEGSLNISGECLHLRQNQSDETLVISFLPANSTEAQQWALTIDFVQKKDLSFEIGNITLIAPFKPELNASAPSGTYHLKDGGDNWFAEGDGYACSSSKFDLDNGSTLEIRNVRVLAFAQLTEDKFPTGQVFSECAADSKTSEIVPIIVGACLAGLVIVVLVAYLIGRARAKRQGYASV